MNIIELRERLRFVMRNLNAGHTANKAVAVVRRIESGKFLERKIAIVQSKCRYFEVEICEVVCREDFGSGAEPVKESGVGFGAGVGTASVLSFFRVYGSSNSLE